MRGGLYLGQPCALQYAAMSMSAASASTAGAELNFRIRLTSASSDIISVASDSALHLAFERASSSVREGRRTGSRQGGAALKAKAGKRSRPKYCKHHECYPSCAHLQGTRARRHRLIACSSCAPVYAALNSICGPADRRVKRRPPWHWFALGSPSAVHVHGSVHACS